MFVSMARVRKRLKGGALGQDSFPIADHKSRKTGRPPLDPRSQKAPSTSTRSQKDDAGQPAAPDYEASNRIGMINVNVRIILELGARKLRELF